MNARETQREATGSARPRRPLISHERLEAWSFVAQILMMIGVIVSLYFVWHELRDNSRIASRNESNATMQQWTAFRTSIYADRDTATLFSTGMEDLPALDATDRLRFHYLIREHGWATFQIWDRARMELVPPSTFDLGAGPDFLRVICTPGGAAAWAVVRTEFPASYVAALDRLAVGFSADHDAVCIPVVAAQQAN